MIDLKTCTEWQTKDKDGLVMPWYTRPALECIFSVDNSGKTVFEWGLGSSSVYWTRKCKALYGVDDNPDYVQAVKNATDHAANVWYEEGEKYINKPFDLGIDFDVIVIDGIHREECMPVALTCLKPNSLIIYDNWMQKSVELQSQKTQDLVLSFKHKIFRQDGHPDWSTILIWP